MLDISKTSNRFIVFEGPDGSGKTTQFRRGVVYLQDKGYKVCEIREPGGTNIGERLRDVLLDHAHKEMTLPTEFFLYMASRAQVVEQKIIPALKRGEIVMADRFYDSTKAYQLAAGGFSRRMSDALFDEICDITCDNTHQNLTVIFDVSPEVAAKRLSPLLDRMEAKGQAFHSKVREAYLSIAKAKPRTHRVIDANRDEETVAADVISCLEDYCTRNGLKP
jgi:dTMP kinase